MLERDTFVLRTHHLQLLIPTLENTSRAEEVAQEVVSSAAIYRGDATRQTVDLARLTAEYSLDDEASARAYGVDVIGDTPDQTKRFGEGILRTLNRFEQLPDEHSVELTTTPDTICEGCAFQTHCANPFTREMDIGGMQEIEEVAAELNVSDDIKVSGATDGQPNKRLHMDAGTLRLILRYI